MHTRHFLAVQTGAASSTGTQRTPGASPDEMPGQGSSAQLAKTQREPATGSTCQTPADPKHGTSSRPTIGAAGSVTEPPHPQLLPCLRAPRDLPAAKTLGSHQPLPGQQDTGSKGTTHAFILTAQKHQSLWRAEFANLPPRRVPRSSVPEAPTPQPLCPGDRGAEQQPGQEAAGAGGELEGSGPAGLACSSSRAAQGRRSVVGSCRGTSLLRCLPCAHPARPGKLACPQVCGVRPLQPSAPGTCSGRWVPAAGEPGLGTGGILPGEVAGSLAPRGRRKGVSRGLCPACPRSVEAKLPDAESF